MSGALRLWPFAALDVMPVHRYNLSVWLFEYRTNEMNSRMAEMRDIICRALGVSFAELGQPGNRY